MKKRNAIFAFVLVLILLISACAPAAAPTQAPGEAPAPAESSAAPAQPAAPVKDTLVVGLTANPVSLDPFKTTDSPAGRVNYAIHETLVLRDAENNIVPGLAESWEIVDDVTYNFKIRQGVKFHNGEELTAEDVKFSFDQQNGNPHAESVTGTVDFENSKVLDTYTFQLKMKEPFGPILQHLAHQVTSIVNKKAYTEAGENYSDHPVGTGPYMFVEWKPDDYVKLNVFEDYWGKKGQIKEVLIRIIPESATRSIEVESGGIDIAVQVSPSEVSRLESNPKVKVYFQESFTTNFVAMNTTRAPFDNVKVRQAINYAIDKEAILKVVYQGIGSVGSAPISPTVWGYNPNLPPFTYNPEKAKELLAEAGYPDGFPMVITTDENQVRRDVAEMVQAQLSQVGIQIEIATLERGAYIGKVIAGELDMFVLGWSTFGDPDYALYASFHSTMHGASGNMSFYSNPEVDKLLEAGRRSVDEASRLEAYTKAQEIIWDESPCVFIQHYVEVTAYSADLQGFAVTPEGYFLFNEMHY